MPRTRGDEQFAPQCAKQHARWCAVVALSVLVGSASAEAQGTVPLPSQPSDSIVRLAVDPARNSGVPYVMLLDESHSRIERDGRMVRRSRQVIQVLDANVVRGMSERAFAYAKSHQALTLDWIRVLRLSGEVVSDKPAQEQETDVTAGLQNPIYQEQRVRRVSLTGVAVGTVLDVQFVIEEKQPYRAGDFLLGWNVNQPIPVARSRFVVDVPEGFAPRIVERNLTFRRNDVVTDGRRIITWAASEVAPYRPETYAADSNGVVMSVAVTAPDTWNDIAGWYDGLARDRYVLAPAAAALVDSLVRASQPRSRTDTIRAVHKWVAQDIRYVSVSLGIGGYQPRLPADVMSSGFGDCKDKTTLFVTALRRYGIVANPVLLALAGKPDATLPSIFQFNHAIAAVQDGAGWTFTDLTAEYVPYGTVPDSYQGEFGIVVTDKGRAEEVRFPLAPTERNQSVLRVAITIDSGGAAVAHVTESSEGSVAVGMRSVFGTPLDSTRTRQLLQALSQRLFTADATADSLKGFNGKDFEVSPALSYVVRADNVLTSVGDARLFTLNPTLRGPARSLRNAARELESRPTRLFPVDAGKVLGMIESVTDVRITLPEGWTAELPKSVSATSFFGRYESTWTQQGREVRMVRRIQGQRGIFPPQRIAEVIVWLKTVGADDHEFLSLRPARAS